MAAGTPPGLQIDRNQGGNQRKRAPNGGFSICRRMSAMETTDDLLDLGLAIIVLRSISRWSQAELARRSGTDRGLLSDYEAGTKRPGRATLDRLADPLDVDATFFDQILPLCRSLRLAYESARQGEGEGSAEEAVTASGVADEVSGALRAALEPHLLRWRQTGGEVD